VITLVSCDKECYEAGDFGSKTLKLIAKDEAAMGVYSEADGGQIRSWMDTGLKSNGDPFVINLYGGWSPTNLNMHSQTISSAPSCSLCFKKLGLMGTGQAYEKQCGCGPILTDSTVDSRGKLLWNSQVVTETTQIDGKLPGTQASINYNDGDFFKCSEIANDEKSKIFSKEWISFPLKTYNKKSVIIGSTANFNLQTTQANQGYLNESCAIKMGVGAYISLWGKDGNKTPKIVYHLASVNSFCPKTLTPILNSQNFKCDSQTGEDLTKVTFRSRGNKIFVKCYGTQESNLTEDEQNSDQCKKSIETGFAKPYYHKPGEVVKLTIYDQYYGDISGSYYVDFLGGIKSATPDGLIASIVIEMD
jgi:hypothetical protein